MYSLFSLPLYNSLSLSYNSLSLAYLLMILYIPFHPYIPKSLLVTNCSGERSFSALKRIKNYLRSTLKDEKLNHVALMHVESSVLRKLTFNDVLDHFVERLTRKTFK